MDDRVRLEERDGIAVIEMNHPERRNAMDLGMLKALLEALGTAGEEARSVVITGAGGSFSSGADVSEELDDAAVAHRMDLFCRLYETVTRFPRPTVAAIQGHCIGGGAEVAGACDLRVGTKGASFMFPGARFGIPVGAARLEALVGLSHSKDLLMTSRTFDAEEAFRIGFLNRLVDEGSEVPEARHLAEVMAQNPGAVSQKRLLDTSSRLTARVLRENRELRRWRP